MHQEFPRRQNRIRVVAIVLLVALAFGARWRHDPASPDLSVSRATLAHHASVEARTGVEDAGAITYDQPEESMQFFVQQRRPVDGSELLSRADPVWTTLCSVLFNLHEFVTRN